MNPRRSSSRFLTAVFLCAFVSVLGCGGPTDESREAEQRSFAGESRIRVEVAEVERRDLSATVELVGNFLPHKRTILVSDVDGAIADIPDRQIEHGGRSFNMPLDIGAEVKKGDLLVQVDDSEFKLQVQVAQANLNRAGKDIAKLKEWTRAEELQTLRAAVSEEEAQLDLARSNLDRAKELIQRNAIPRSELERLEAESRVAVAALDRAKAALDTALAGPTEAEIEVAKAAIAQAQAEVDKAQWKIDRSKIKAPYDAVITDRFVDEGDRVTAMPRVEIMELMDISILTAEVCVPEQYIHSIQVRDLASIVTQDSPEPVQGLVVRINNKVDPATRTFRTRIAVDNGNRRFRAGQFVRVLLQVQTSSSALTVPRSAITYAGGQAQVFACRDGRVERKRVELGIQTEEAVEILSGLSEGESVVVHDPAVLTDQMPVEVKTTSKVAQISRRAK